MRVIPPVPITDAVLVSSTILETAPAPFVAGTVYPADALVSTGEVGALLTVYRSLQPNNVGKPPAQNPVWWLEVGTTYGAYSDKATYGLDALVLDPATHKVYESQVAGNVGQALSNESKWLFVRMSNRHAMFDYMRNTLTVSQQDITVVLRPRGRINSLALRRVEGAAFNVTVRVDGEEVYSKSSSLIKRKSHGLYDYIYGAFKQVKNVMLTDLPPYRDPEITLKISRPGAGQRSCGACVVGNHIYIGEVEYGAESDPLNFSVVERNQWGDATLLPIRAVPIAKTVVEFERNRMDKVLEVRDLLNAVPAIYAGLDDFGDDYFAPLFFLGIWKQFAINMKEPTRSFINLELEEI